MLRDDLQHQLENMAKRENRSVDDLVEDLIHAYRPSPKKHPKKMFSLPLRAAGIFFLMLLLFLGGGYLLAAAVNADLLSEETARLLTVPITVLAISIAAMGTAYQNRREQQERDEFLKQLPPEEYEWLDRLYHEATLFLEKEF